MAVKIIYLPIVWKVGSAYLSEDEQQARENRRQQITDKATADLDDALNNGYEIKLEMAAEVGQAQCAVIVLHLPAPVTANQTGVMGVSPAASAER